MTIALVGHQLTTVCNNNINNNNNSNKNSDNKHHGALSGVAFVHASNVSARVCLSLNHSQQQEARIERPHC